MPSDNGCTFPGQGQWWAVYGFLAGFSLVFLAAIVWAHWVFLFLAVILMVACMAGILGFFLGGYLWVVISKVQTAITLRKIRRYTKKVNSSDWRMP